jgi:tetratricopeptide (TPR) repeat protein
LKYGQNNLKYAISANDSNWLAYAYGLLAVTYNGLDKTEKAKACLEKCIPYLHAVPAAERVDFYDDLAVLYIDKDRNQARKVYETALKYGQAPLTYYGLGYLEYMDGNKEKANAYFQKALHTKEPLLKLDTYDNLLNLYYKNGDFKEACHYASKRINLKDSLDLQAKKADVGRLQMKFDYDTAQIKLKQRIFFSVYLAVILIFTGILVYLLKRIKASRLNQQILQDQLLIHIYQKKLGDIQKKSKDMPSGNVTNSGEDEKQLKRRISEINEYTIPQKLFCVVIAVLIFVNSKYISL